MCELLAVSASRPLTASLSLAELAAHGGRTGPHRDGWGVSYYLGPDVRLLKDAEAAADSELIRFMARHRFQSELIIAHIRHRSRGAVSYANTQPFCREIGGRFHVFVHNGDLADVERLVPSGARRYRPVGETDSEVAACVLFGRLAALWERGGIPSVASRYRIVSDLAAELRECGPANFLYADGDLLFAHSHVRPPRPGADPVGPGLHLLCRDCVSAGDPLQGGGVRLEHISPGQQAVLVASVPLTGEAWTPIAEGSVLTLRAGRVIEPRMAAAAHDPTGERDAR